MENIGLESSELLRIFVLGAILLVGLGVLRMVLRLTARVLTGGCLVIVIIVVALIVWSATN